MISAASLSSLEIKIAAIQRYKHNCACWERVVNLVICCCILILACEKKYSITSLCQIQWLQVGSHRAEGGSLLPQPAGHVSFNATQNMTLFLSCKHTLPAHFHCFFHWMSKSFFSVLLSIPSSPCDQWYLGLLCLRFRTFYLALLNFMNIWAQFSSLWKFLPFLHHHELHHSVWYHLQTCFSPTVYATG